MKKVKLIFFEPGQKAEHEGVTYTAELQAKGGLCYAFVRVQQARRAVHVS